MSERRKKRPRDANQLAKLVVDIATGEEVEVRAHKSEESEAAILGRRGGLKGGKARAEKLSADRRREIAKQAAAARWERKK